MRSRIATILLEAMLLAFSGPLAAATPAAAARAALDEAAAARFAALALKCLHQQYPNHISHTLGGDADARAPRELTPAFYGCSASAARADAGLLRLLRLALGGACSLAAGAVDPSHPRCAVRTRGTRRGGAEPRARQHRG